MDQYLSQAMETVNAWAAVGRGQEGFDWQYHSLTQQSSHVEAEELQRWWDAHPGNPSNANTK